MIITHPSCLKHDPGPGHPECPQRLLAVLAAIEQPRFARIARVLAPQASVEQLARVHAPELIERVFAAAPEHGTVRLDPDTAMSVDSLDAALRAAGAACVAVDAVMRGKNKRAFCAVRPPGHHATAARAMGFCLFNSVAVGVAHALAAHALDRVALVDFDVHHGNGSQDIFWHEARVLFTSSHESALYPGSGSPSERGAARNIMNRALAPGSGSAEFRAVYTDHILPAIGRFEPQLIVISAGFDAHRLDPLANLNLDADDYAWVTGELVQLAKRHAHGRIVSSLEGGYSLSGLNSSVAAHLHALFETA